MTIICVKASGWGKLGLELVLGLGSKLGLELGLELGLGLELVLGLRLALGWGFTEGTRLDLDPKVEGKGVGEGEA